jgi:hypothetical protein
MHHFREIDTMVVDPAGIEPAAVNFAGTDSTEPDPSFQNCPRVLLGGFSFALPSSLQHATPEFHSSTDIGLQKGYTRLDMALGRRIFVLGGHHE